MYLTTDLPVYIHLLRRLCGFVICNFGWDSKHDDEGNDPTGYIDRCVRLVRARVIGITGWVSRGDGCHHPDRSLIVLTRFLVESVLLILAAEAQVARPAAVPMVRVVALEHFVILAAHVVVAQANIVAAGGGRLRCLVLVDRRDYGGFEILSPPLFGLLPAGSAANDAQRVQVYY